MFIQRMEFICSLYLSLSLFPCHSLSTTLTHFFSFTISLSLPLSTPCPHLHSFSLSHTHPLFLSISHYHSLRSVGGCGIEASWAGGLNGRVVIDRFLPLLEVEIKFIFLHFLYLYILYLFISSYLYLSS